MNVVVPLTGEVRAAQIFVVVLGASGSTFVEATWTQGLPDWIGFHQRSFQFFGGVTELMVIDNLKSGVRKAWLTATSSASTRPTRRWPSIMARQFCKPGYENPVTKPRPRWGCN
ncbi:hypothetical protein DFAR_1760015 [Desulfarculales bacterium]